MLYKLEKTCLVCGDTFRAKRRGDAKTCSPTCRKRLSRNGEIREAMISRITNELSWLAHDKLTPAETRRNDLLRLIDRAMKLTDV